MLGLLESVSGSIWVSVWGTISGRFWVGSAAGPRAQRLLGSVYGVSENDDEKNYGDCHYEGDLFKASL